MATYQEQIAKLSADAKERTIQRILEGIRDGKWFGQEALAMAYDAGARSSPDEAEQLEELAQMCDRIAADDYQKINSTHGERLAWCHGAVACVDAIRALKRRDDTSCEAGGTK